MSDERECAFRRTLGGETDRTCERPILLARVAQLEDLHESAQRAADGQIDYLRARIAQLEGDVERLLAAKVNHYAVIDQRNRTIDTLVASLREISQWASNFPTRKAIIEVRRIAATALEDPT